MSPANYWKLGLFIVVCLALGLATLAFIGAQKFDREVSVVHYFFNEPVDGLSVGSQIRLRGIPIGAVTAIGLADDLIHVQVEGEIDVATLERLGLKEPGIDLEADVMRERLREKGLRAFLERNMLTGVSLINSDYFEEFRGTFPEYPFELPMRTIPTMPSTFKGIMTDLEATLSWLREELPGTVDRVQHLIIELDHAIVELDTGRISSDLKELLRELRGSGDEIETRLERRARAEAAARAEEQRAGEQSEGQGRERAHSDHGSIRSIGERLAPRPRKRALGSRSRTSARRCADSRVCPRRARSVES